MNACHCVDNQFCRPPAVRRYHRARHGISDWRVHTREERLVNRYLAKQVYATCTHIANFEQDLRPELTLNGQIELLKIWRVEIAIEHKGAEDRVITINAQHL